MTNVIPHSYIACIGSRETPPEAIQWMESTGAALVRAGFGIISGNAPGADQAWARGGNSVDPEMVTLCLPWATFEGHAVHPKNVVQLIDYAARRCESIVKMVHPRTESLSPGSFRLHGRNVMIVEPSTLVVGYLNPQKRGGGGTGTAFKIAKLFKIPTMNVAHETVRNDLLAQIEAASAFGKRAVL